MAKSVPVGARGEMEQTVEFKHTLTAYHPKLPPVYSTPDMIRLMETAAFNALQPYCEGDEITVGTAINVEHRAASGVGARIKAEAVLESLRGRMVEDAGFPALATTSAGVAYTLGYPDGLKISRQEMLSVVARIAGAVKVPVTADVEAGYGDRPEDAAFTARGVIQAGAVGLNLEDGREDADNPLVDLSLQLEKIAAIREEAADPDIPIVLNARTDVYLNQVGDPEK